MSLLWPAAPLRVWMESQMNGLTRCRLKKSLALRCRQSGFADSTRSTTPPRSIAALALFPRLNEYFVGAEQTARSDARAGGGEPACNQCLAGFCSHAARPHTHRRARGGGAGTGTPPVL